MRREELCKIITASTREEFLSTEIYDKAMELFQIEFDQMLHVESINKRSYYYFRLNGMLLLMFHTRIIPLWMFKELTVLLNSAY